MYRGYPGCKGTGHVQGYTVCNCNALHALAGRSHTYCQGGVLLEDSTEMESLQKLKTDLKDHTIAAVCKTNTVDVSLPITESLMDMYVRHPRGWADGL